MLKPSFFTLIYALTGLFFPLVGQQVSQDTIEFVSQPVEVKATHSILQLEESPLSIATKTRSIEEISSQPALTLDKLTYDIPGIWVNNRHNYALGQRIMIRGVGWRAAFGVRGIQVILDGIPLTTADGQTVTNLVDPSFVRRMEVLRGPASTFWGNSSGGVLYLSTRPNYEKAPFLRIRGLAGSYGLRKSGVEFIRKWGSDRLHVFGSYMRKNGFREHSQVKLGRIGLTSRLQLNPETQLRLFGAFASMPVAENPSTLTKVRARKHPRAARDYFSDNNAREIVDHGQVGASIYHQTAVGTITLTTYGIYRNLVSPLPFAYIKLDRRMGGVRAMIENTTERWTWKAGLEGKYQHDDRLNYNTVNGKAGDKLLLDQLETVTNLSGFGLVKYQLLPDLQVSSGIRYDWMHFEADDHLLANGDQSGQRKFHAVSPSVGISYSIGNQKVYTNVGTAFEAPTTTELVNRPGGKDGFNPSIGPEHTLSTEVGIRGNTASPPLLSYQLSVYSMWINNLLMPYQIEGSSRVYYRNEGQTRHRGLEVLFQAYPTSSLDLSLSYSMIKARFLEGRTSDGTTLDGKQIPGIPEHRLGFGANWTPHELRIHADIQWVSTFPVNSLNTHYNDDYWTANLRISHSGFSLSDQITLQPFFAVDNITNNRYNSSITVNASGNRYYEPAPGRHWTAGLNLSVKNL